MQEERRRRVMVNRLLPPSHICLLVLIVASSSSLGNGVSQEGLALLSFKGFISEDPYGSLTDWNASGSSPCSWNGVTCRDGVVVALSIPRRRLAGSISPSLGSLPSLRHVNLRSNRLNGSLPHELFSAGGLQSLVLSGNYLSGTLFPGIGNLSNLQILDISQNLFGGLIPSSLLMCSRLKALDLSSNGFSGPLPSGFGNSFDMLQRLNLSYNQFNGSIPSDIGNLSGLRDTVDFSHNLFSGSIPPGIGNLPEKVYIDLTYNNLSGPIPQNGALVNRGPTAFIGNPHLCGPPLRNPCFLESPAAPRYPASALPPVVDFRRNGNHRGLSKAVVVAIIASDVVGMCLIALVFLYCYRKAVALRRIDDSEGIEKEPICSKECLCFRKEATRTPSDNEEQMGLVPLDRHVNFNLDELLKASAFVLGKSGVGIVYRVVLEDGLNLAVRRLGEGGSERFKEFRSEVEAIGKVRHPNIVALRAYYWSLEEKLLVYDYIPNGNLSSAIHGEAGTTEYEPLSWRARLNIIIGIAKGLTYLHEVSPKKYVHGDLETSNILLRSNMEPCISDFGVGRLATLSGSTPMAQSSRMLPEKPSIQASDIMISPLVGTAFCYQAPESLKTLKPSQKWDIYSFGVILLELLSGRPPIVQLGDSEITLVQWVTYYIEERKPLSELLDPSLIQESEREDEIIEVLKIALSCVKMNPERRPPMRHVLESLEKLTATP